MTTMVDSGSSIRRVHGLKHCLMLVSPEVAYLDNTLFQAYSGALSYLPCICGQTPCFKGFINPEDEAYSRPLFLYWCNNCGLVFGVLLDFAGGRVLDVFVKPSTITNITLGKRKKMLNLDELYRLEITYLGNKVKI